MSIFIYIVLINLIYLKKYYYFEKIIFKAIMTFFNENIFFYTYNIYVYIVVNLIKFYNIILSKIVF